MWLLILLKDKREINSLLNMNKHSTIEETFRLKSGICSMLSQQFLNAYCVPRLRKCRQLKGKKGICPSGMCFLVIAAYMRHGAVCLTSLSLSFLSPGNVMVMFQVHSHLWLTVGDQEVANTVFFVRFNWRIRHYKRYKFARTEVGSPCLKSKTVQSEST